MADISVGYRFSSYEDVERFIHEYEERHCVQLCTYTSRSIENAKKRGIRRHLNSMLQFYEIVLRCIHGGSRKSRSTGARPGQRSCKQECPFLIKLRISSDGNYLEIANLVENHNHSHNKGELRKRKRVTLSQRPGSAKHHVETRKSSSEPGKKDMDILLHKSPSKRTCNFAKPAEDEFTVFGKFVEIELRNISEASDRAEVRRVKREIQEVIWDQWDRIKTYTESSDHTFIEHILGTPTPESDVDYFELSEGERE